MYQWMYARIRYVLIFAGFFLLQFCKSTDSCVQIKKNNCFVSEETYHSINKNNMIDSLVKRIGKPYFFVPENVEKKYPVGNFGRYGWRRYPKTDVLNNVFMYLETKKGFIVSKKIQIIESGRILKEEKVVFTTTDAPPH